MRRYNKQQPREDVSPFYSFFCSSENRKNKKKKKEENQAGRSFP